MRRFAILLAFFVVIAACGDDDASTTLPPDADTPTETSAPVGDTTATTVLQAVDATGPTDCLEIWPEAAVQAVTGSGIEFFEANADRSACVYLGLPNSLALAWRSGDRFGFDTGKSGVAAVGGATDIAVCDIGYYTELEGAGIIMEAHSDGQGRTYTATVTGIELDTALNWATALLEGVC